MKKLALIVAVLAACILVFILWPKKAESPTLEQTPQTEPAATNLESETFTAQEIEIAPTEYSIDEVDSLWLVVNKDRPIPLEYVPEGLRTVEVLKREDKSADELMLREEAAVALEAMFEAATAEEISLLMGSAYRSASLQEFYYTNYVNAFGQEEADKFSARPGTSEHQTGLSADVSPESRVCYLEICFEDTEEGKWVSANAHLYGFVVRYPDGKEDITGYQYEPWHLRYVGEELAQNLYESKQTLEEYFSL